LTILQYRPNGILRDSLSQSQTTKINLDKDIYHKLTVIAG